MEKRCRTKQDLAQEDDVETVETYQDALQFVVSHMPVDASKRNILVAHQFVTGLRDVSRRKFRWVD